MGPVLVENCCIDPILFFEQHLTLATNETIDLLLLARADTNLGSQGQGKSFSVLHEVVRMGDLSLTAKILAAQADVNKQDMALGFTPLHMAAKTKDSYDIVKLLVDARAEVTRVI